jgi:DNA-directed RNA polymerase specialized sigma24 family protein
MSREDDEEQDGADASPNPWERTKDQHDVIRQARFQEDKKEREERLNQAFGEFERGTPSGRSMLFYELYWYIHHKASTGTSLVTRGHRHHTTEETNEGLADDLSIKIMRNADEGNFKGKDKDGKPRPFHHYVNRAFRNFFIDAQDKRIKAFKDRVSLPREGNGSVEDDDVIDKIEHRLFNPEQKSWWNEVHPDEDYQEQPPTPAPPPLPLSRQSEQYFWRRLGQVAPAYGDVRSLLAEGKKQKDIARMLGRSEATVSNMLAEMRKHLKTYTENLQKLQNGESLQK